jgi:hypothetical protein
MVINQIYICGVSILKPEDDSPICPNRYTPKPCKIAFKGGEVCTLASPYLPALKSFSIGLKFAAPFQHALR